MAKPRDEADRLKDGDLAADPFADAERAAPALRAVKPGDKRAPTEPCDLAAERALLGALLWAGANQPEALRVAAVLDLLENGEPFFERAHGHVFEAIRACAAARAEHDPVAVHEQLVRAGHDRAAGGMDALRALADNASTVKEQQARVYADAIRRTWAKRVAIRGLRTLADDARSPKADLGQLVEKAQAIVAELAQRATTTAASVSIAESLKGLRRRLEAGVNTAIPTGLRDVDRALNGGLRPGEVTVLAARTNVGKSLLAAQIAEHMVSADPSVGALYVTLEMSHEMFTARLLSARSGVPLSKLRRSAVDMTEWRALTAAENELARKGLYFADAPSQTIAAVYATALERARLLGREGRRLGLIVIDHLGLVKPSAEALKKASREGQVAETSRGQRYLAAHLGVHVLGIAQIGRAAEQKGAEGMPKLHHLRESGALEQDADTVLILHRERDPQTGLFNRDKPPAIALAKGRMEEHAIELLSFDRGRARFGDWNGDESFGDFYGL